MMTEIRPYWKNYINGEFVDGASGERIVVSNPATNEPIAEVARAVPADVDKAVAAARQAFESRELWEMRPHRRGDLMFEVSRQLEKLVDEIATVECFDNGKTLAAGRAEVALTQRYLSYYGGMADKLEGRQIPLGEGLLDYTIHAPFGVWKSVV